MRERHSVSLKDRTTKKTKHRGSFWGVLCTGKMVIKDAIGTNGEILNMLPCESHMFANYYGVLSPRESVLHTVFNCILFTKALANRTTM